ncbi:unnamed protein product [Paramecium sonneborni]|uniref:Uncharacterized protein n=1 Tax=Paramecium sonneborni TaxID=65129 RepID=A0A8S1QPY1_9CILI|nr:unnamed protein product [Paramecium sonneborni]
MLLQLEIFLDKSLKRRISKRIFFNYKSYFKERLQIFYKNIQIFINLNILQQLITIVYFKSYNTKHHKRQYFPYDLDFIYNKILILQNEQNCKATRQHA